MDTIFLGQLLGLYMLGMGIVTLGYFREWQEALEEFMASKLLYYLVAQSTFIVGLILVLSHSKFDNDPLTIMVTIIAYLVLVKGIVLLALPHHWLNVVVEFFNRTVWFIIGGIFWILLSGVLLFFSFVWPYLESLTNV